MSDTHAAENAASEAAAAQAQAGSDPDVEARARRMGWKPKEEFRGPEDRWTPADAYVARAETEHPVLLERYRVLDDKYAKLERALEGSQSKISEQTAVLRELAEFSSKGEQRAYARAKRELEDKMKVAVAHADTDTYAATKAELDKLEAPRPIAAAQTEARQQQQQPAIDPLVASWVRDNTWFDKDPEARAAATGICGDLQARGVPLGEALTKVREVIAKRFPEHFENPARSQAASVATPGAAPSTKPRNPRSYESLPPDAKKACDRFVKQIPGFTREQYVEQFDWSA